MKYDWITIALEQGANLNCMKYIRGYRAAVSWKNQLPVMGNYCATFSDALQSLDAAIKDSAADECES
jgi:hypothetical protein